jgi:hypothetical protein
VAGTNSGVGVMSRTRLLACGMWLHAAAAMCVFHVYEEQMGVLNMGGVGGATGSVRGWSGMLCCHHGSDAVHVRPP